MLDRHQRVARAGAFFFSLLLEELVAGKTATEREWVEAAQRCRLSSEEVRMARELGFKTAQSHREHSQQSRTVESACRRRGPRALRKAPAPNRAAAQTSGRTLRQGEAETRTGTVC
jgi:hypothetical protein